MNKSFMDNKGIVLNCNAGGKFLTVVTWARLFSLPNKYAKPESKCGHIDQSMNACYM